MSDVAVGTASQVGVEVVPSAPSRTVATTIVLIVAVAVVAVLVVVCQREQEVAAVTCVTVTGTPRRCSVATNQSTGIQLDDCYRRAFAVASAMERRRTSTVNGALIAQGPTLVCVANPGVDPRLIRVAQEVTTVEQGSVANGSCSVVTTVATATNTATTTRAAARKLTEITTAAATVVLTLNTTARTLTVTLVVTAVGTGCLLDPGSASTSITVVNNTLVCIGLTDVTNRRCRRRTGISSSTTVLTAC